MTSSDTEPSLTEPAARYWPDGDIVTPEIEKLLDRMIATVHRTQARTRQ